MTIAEFVMWLYVPLFPLLFVMLETNRRGSKRTWKEQISLLNTGLKSAFKKTRTIWVCLIAAAILWRLGMSFVDIPVQSDSATFFEMGFLVCSLAFFALVIVGVIVATYRTASLVWGSLNPASPSLIE